MERKRDRLVPVAEALGDLDGSVKAIRAATPQAVHHFTQADQVNLLVGASEANPDRGFMARMMALCCAFIMFTCTGSTGSRYPPNQWFDGGTLHRSTVAEWRVATEANRLATSADFAVALMNRTGARPRTMDGYRPKAEAVKTCITEAAREPTPATMEVSELASACGILLM